MQWFVLWTNLQSKAKMWSGPYTDLDTAKRFQYELVLFGIAIDPVLALQQEKQ